ncbi:sensor domain-containing diguanylate cyclase [uncultured Gimesia sp.]|uniref:sensor domain-containing diguanylate cyclase n=1 Tax=uncultured Gimesia sp. TaxID=1678688 RepID=UPI0030DD61A2|tara:strand:- start:97569 stop:99227 length:1659 start_codon:yes stop_codon:yes gene_type:complete
MSVVAIACVCLLQYAVYSLKMSAFRKENEEFQRNISAVEEELNDVQSDRAMTLIENHILREFVTQSEFDQTIELLLKRYVPSLREGFGVYLNLIDGEFRLGESRGIIKNTNAVFEIDRDLLHQLRSENVLVLRGKRLRESQIYASFHEQDRTRVQKLCLMAVYDKEDVSGIFITTDLYPKGVEEKQQIKLAKRLLICISRNIVKNQDFESHRYELRVTREQLELRSLADQQYKTPVKMLEEFMDRLRQLTNSSRAGLFLSTPGEETGSKAIVQCGIAQQAGVKARWREHEINLVKIGLNSGENTSLTGDQLEKHGIRSLIGAALVSPLVTNRKRIGAICLTSQEGQPYDERSLRLISWASQFLSNTLLKVLSHATIERQAKQDGLTGLVNRRSFDELIEDEFNRAHSMQMSCSLILIDLDHFKLVNDNYGHQAGDEVLRRVAHILRERIKEIRSSDSVIAARYGGEELAILLPDIGLAGTERIAEVIRHSIESAMIDFNGTVIPVTASLGISTYAPHVMESVEAMVAAADSALYQAKAEGRNRVCSLTSSPV